jgi:tRNA C32,U32 (ribose-2'-O)-methylase TrmJ
VKRLAALDEVVSAADDVIALTSLRGRASRGLPPPTTFKEISSSLRARRRVALVFGPERGGLTTEELKTCDARLRIATADAFPTLNLAQSVAISLSNLYSLEESPRRRRGILPTDEQPAPARDVRRLLSSLKETLSSAGYPGRGHSKEVSAEIESFVKRGKPTAREVTLLLGALAAVRRRLLPALAAFALALPAAAAVPDVTITDVTVAPASSADQPCPVTLTFRASVLLDMKSKFTYEWKVSTGEADKNRHEPTWADGVHPVVLTQEWRLGERTPAFHPYHGWVKLYVRSPRPILSEPAEFTIDCGPPAKSP